MSDGAAIIVGNKYRPGPTVITCEHASNRVPPPLVVSEADRPWMTTHWAWDIGTEVVTRDLVRQLDAVAVLSTFSRLVCDPNRDIDDPTWIREEVEGHPIGFNQSLSHRECQRRYQRYHEPYHRTVDKMLADSLRCNGEVVMLSVHSFTPRLNGERRRMEAGVLYDKYPELAGRLYDRMESEGGFKVALNEPYSGMAGMMSVARRHGTTYGVIYLQLELRQDLIATAEDAVAVARRVGRALRASGIIRRRNLRIV